MTAQGPPSQIAFVLKGYPRVSETFIAQEIFMLEQRGFPILIISMRKAREPERQPVVALIKAPIIYVPEYIWPSLQTILSENVQTFQKNPRRYLKYLTIAAWRSLCAMDDSPIKRFLQAGWTLAKIKSVHHLHSHFAHAPTELAWYMAKLSAGRYTISAHAKDIYTLSKKELTRRINDSELIMTCTGFNDQYMRALPGIDKKKIHKVYHGINLENFRPTRADNLSATELLYNQEKLKLLSVGRLVEKKGYSDIFLALKILADNQFLFVYDIYGAGELKDHLVKQVQELGLQDSVVFHNTTTHPQIITRMNEGGIFLCGSRIGKDGDRDGIPNTLAEAMAMELPVIATNVSGIPELVENQVSGLLIDEADPQQLAGGIEFLAKNPEQAQAYGRAARQRVEKAFNCEEWIKICANLLAPFAKVRS